jgi:uncharacterized membrane protein
MLKDNITLRAIAREKLSGKWVNSSLAILLIYNVTVMISMVFAIPYYIVIFSQAFSQIPNANDQNYPYSYSEQITPAYVISYIILIIGAFLVSGIMTYGINYFFLKLVRNDLTDISDAFAGFKNLEKSIKTGFLIEIFTFLWSLLFVIPGIVARFKYSMSFYLLIDHPELSPLEAINASVNIMYTKKEKLFFLYLSLIGWYALTLIICLVTCGLGAIFALPAFVSYQTTTFAAFYEDIKEDYTKIDLGITKEI